MSVSDVYWLIVSWREIQNVHREIFFFSPLLAIRYAEDREEGQRHGLGGFGERCGGARGDVVWEEKSWTGGWRWMRSAEIPSTGLMSSAPDGYLSTRSTPSTMIGHSRKT